MLYSPGLCADVVTVPCSHHCVMNFEADDKWEKTLFVDFLVDISFFLAGKAATFDKVPSLLHITQLWISYMYHFKISTGLLFSFPVTGLDMDIGHWPSGQRRMLRGFRERLLCF